MSQTVTKIKAFNQPFTYLGKKYIGTVRYNRFGEQEVLVCEETDREQEASEEVYEYFFNLMEWYGVI